MPHEPVVVSDRLPTVRAHPRRSFVLNGLSGHLVPCIAGSPSSPAGPLVIPLRRDRLRDEIDGSRGPTETRCHTATAPRTPRTGNLPIPIGAKILGVERCAVMLPCAVISSDSLRSAEIRSSPGVALQAGPFVQQAPSNVA